MPHTQIINTFPEFLKYWEKIKIYPLIYKLKTGRRSIWHNGLNCLRGRLVIMPTDK
jgi:hypothetical protein